MSGKPQSRLDHLIADALRRPHSALPAGLSAADADPVTRLACAGGSIAELKAACRDVTFRDGYKIRRLADDFDLRELVKLARAARIELERLDAEIAPRALAQRKMLRLLTAAATIDDEITDGNRRMSKALFGDADVDDLPAFLSDPPAGVDFVREDGQIQRRIATPASSSMPAAAAPIDTTTTTTTKTKRSIK